MKTTEGLRAAIRSYHAKYGVVPRTKDMEDWYSWCRKNYVDFRAERAAALPFTVRTEAMLRAEILALASRTGSPPSPEDMTAWYGWCGREGHSFVRIRDAALNCRVIPGIPTSRTEAMLRAEMRTFIDANGRAPASREMYGWYLWCVRYGVSFIAARNQVFGELDSEQASEVMSRSKPQLQLRRQLEHAAE